MTLLVSWWRQPSSSNSGHFPAVLGRGRAHLRPTPSIRPHLSDRRSRTRFEVARIGSANHVVTWRVTPPYITDERNSHSICERRSN